MKFLRSDFWRYSKLGKNRKKLQKWRRAKGRHSKVREKRKGYPRMPTVGYRTESSLKGKINNLVPILVHNLKELETIKKGQGIIIAKIGAKKKIEVLKKAEEMKIKIINVREGNKK